ncbi:xanthine dehydrogenase family protein molybdopterin-binding subunit [Pseudonocardia acaciae]|uniref:xanthine dehydrogenase family protein molybdopterin-binding subunit n=1 Tax=Pseudonocardia acaciae TaxID=551276 RepID=UPI0004907BA1|nr:xanthine dehydrogenase family protein molybdopterin-binding subunit [Pseudonocardia acaciae]
MAERLIGRSVPRRANIPLLTGAARYVADIRREGQVYARVVRGSSAHARIAHIDTEEAASAPGVLAVITAKDIPDVRIPIRLPMFETPEANRLLQPPLARDQVRYVGEPVAVVVATDPYLAEDAAELVWVDLDELDPVIELDAARAPGAPLVHAEHGSNTVNTVRLAHGDVADAFGRADVVVSDRIRMRRSTAVPLETRGLLAEPDPDTGELTLWGGAKVKHFTRHALATMLGIEPGRIRVAETTVGGGFGVRGEPYPEDFLVCFLALRLGRPVSWVEDRAEHLVATNHAREQVHDIEIAATSDGRLLALRDRAWCDHGGYVRSQGILPELLPALHIAGPYAWPAFEVESTGVLTHRTPVGTFRGPGMTEATFVRERVLDRLAARLGLDPAELRRRNLVPAAAMPYRIELDPTPITYESGDFPGSLATLLERSGYDGLRAERERRRGEGECVGIGLATYVEVGAIGPYEDAKIVIEPTGRVTVHVAVGSLGQGVETVLAQIAAESLGVGMDDVTVEFGDTAELPMGFGAFASRSTVLAGNAIVLAARDLRERAATELGAAPSEVELVDGHARTGAGDSIPLGKLGPAHGRFEKPHPSFSFGAALSLVRVDRATGKVSVLRHVVLHDVGRAVNPALLRGQLVGAAAQGIGGALLEELTYDENGQPTATSFSDYLLPTVGELPDIEVIVVEHPTPGNPLGLKGGGESGMVGTPAAVANAVADALGERGDRVRELPLTPRRVRALLNTTPEE